MLFLTYSFTQNMSNHGNKKLQQHSEGVNILYFVNAEQHLHPHMEYLNNQSKSAISHILHTNVSPPTKIKLKCKVWYRIEL